MTIEEYDVTFQAPEPLTLARWESARERWHAEHSIEIGTSIAPGLLRCVAIAGGVRKWVDIWASKDVI